ncbi:MAG: hypothetical protein IJD47_04435 [Clostridia bacterium]|nr:hypothetical protein [Clostridia bacterium]MBQ3042426.1 hypothetical protein [Clostridia bacterium]
MKTVNIYYIYDASVKMQHKAKKQIEENISRISRALVFTNCNTKLHLIGYRDQAFVGRPFTKITTYGNPNFAQGLSLLENIIQYEAKYSRSLGRSVFIWHSSGNVLEGWKKPLERLYKNKNFAFGLKYVVQHGKPDQCGEEAFFRFAQSQERILHYFGEGRLCRLIKQICSI